MAVEVVLDLHFLAGQNDSSPPDITGTHVIFADNVRVGRQYRNRSIRFIPQTVIGLVDRLGTLHLLSIAYFKVKVTVGFQNSAEERSTLPYGRGSECDISALHSTPLICSLTFNLRY